MGNVTCEEQLQLPRHKEKGGELISFFKYGKNYCNKESNNFSPMFKCEGFAL